MFRFDKSRLILKPLLGEGGFGKVHLYQKNKEDYGWAIKRMPEKDSKVLLEILPEIIVGFACDHPSILKVQGYKIEPTEFGDFNVYIKLPRMEKNMHQHIADLKSQEKRFSEQELIKIL